MKIENPTDLLLVIDRVVVVVDVFVGSDKVAAVDGPLLRRADLTLRDVVDAQLLVAAKVPRRFDLVDQHHVTLQNLKPRFLVNMSVGPFGFSSQTISSPRLGKIRWHSDTSLDGY